MMYPIPLLGCMAQPLKGTAGRLPLMGLLPVLLILVAFALGAEALEAQDRPGAQPADTVELIFEREVFNYPAFQRRNPFRPLTGEDAGPRFEELRLLGVILSNDRSGSVALLGPRSVGGGQAGGGRSWRVREGDAIGNMRVLAIRAREIVLEVDDFGVREARTLQVERAAPQAEESPPGTGREEDVGERPEGAPPTPPGGTGGSGVTPDTTGGIGSNGSNGGMV